MFELYFLKTCPYCKKVIDYCENSNIQLILKDITDIQNKEMLISQGGKEQVPYLFDNEKNIGLYESDEIIKYIKMREV